MEQAVGIEETVFERIVIPNKATYVPVALSDLIMGAPLARNRLPARFEVTVRNRTAAKCEPLREAGAAVAETPEKLAAGVDAACLNLTDTPDVEEVLFGDRGIEAGAKPGLIVIDHSTIDPSQTRRFAERLAQRQVTLVDAPVSGGDTGAKQGTLSIMVGGPAEAVDRCRPIFEAVGSKINHMGDAGSGQLCKACNQVAVSCNLVGVVEAIKLAAADGLDVRKMIDVVSGGAGGSWQLENLGPKAAASDFEPGFMIDLILKDLSIVKAVAEKHGLSLAGVTQALDYFRRAADTGHGRDGTQAIASVVE